MGKSPLGRIVASAPVPQPTTNFAPIWLIDALGYAADEGLNFHIELAGTPKDAADAVISGKSDFTFINIVFTLLARDRGVPLRPFYAFVRAQNRSFSVPRGSTIQSLADLRGKTIGLYYNDPELFQFACAALRSAGVDPQKDVSFISLPGTPLDAERMAAALRDNEVQAVWQLDVFAGFMAAEGVPLRLLPALAIDRLTPSSCLLALDANLAGRPDAFAALGRSLAKATLFTLTNPTAAVQLMWERYPGAAPNSAALRERAFKRELAALEVRVGNQRIDQARGAQWGAITEAEMVAWQDFMLETRAIANRRPPSTYFSNEFVTTYNDFDPIPVIAAARNFKLTS